MTRRAAAILATVFLAATAVQAGTLELTFTKPDREQWEYEGVTDADFTPEGLRFHFPKGTNRKPKQIVLKQYFVDDTDVQAWVDRSNATDPTQAVLVLDNPELKRRAEMAFILQPYPPRAGRRAGSYSHGALTYYKDGTAVGRRSGWDNESGPGERVRLRKVSRRMHGAVQSQTPGGLLRWATTHYPQVDFDEDCDRFRMIFVVVPPPDGEATTLVLRSLSITGPQVGSPDVDRNEPRVIRFDFGPVQQEVADDYIGVNPETMYTPGRGYGWKTDLKPMVRGGFEQLTNEESIRLGLGASHAEEGWRRSADLQLNWTRKVKLRPLLSTAHGWDHIEELGRTYDLKTPQEKDVVFACRHYGFPHDYRIEADQWEKRGAIYVDDDLATDFVVDVPNGRYNAIVGIGYSIGGPYFNAPLIFSIEAEGRTVLKDMRQNWARCDRFLINDIEVADGQLTLTFRGDRRVSMNEVAPYNLACGWLVNYLVVCPAEDPAVLDQEEWRLILDRSRRVRQLTFEPGNPAHVGLTDDGYIQLNGKPFMPIVLQYGYGWPRTTYHLYTWANTYTEGLASSEIGGSAAFFRKDWKKMSMWDNYPWRAIAAMNSAVRHGNLDFLYCENFVYIVPRAIAGEGGRLEDSRGRQNRWSVKPPLASRLAMEILRESYTMISTQLKLHPANCGYYIYEEFVHPENYGYDYQSVTKFREYLATQYRDIGELNREWKRNYASFDDVEPPKGDWEESPEWRHFWKFRRYSMTLQATKASEMAKSLEPEHTTMGQKCKPHPMSTTWYTAPAVELFGGGGPPSVHRAGAKHFGRALSYNAGYWDCPWSWVDGRRQLDHKPKERRYIGRHLLSIYNDMISRYFQGVKGFWSEEYNDGVRHMFHRTGLIKRDSPKGKIKTWFGDIVFYDREAHDFGPVTPCLPPLRFSRAVQLGYRLGPLFLPARPLRGEIAVLMTEDAFLVRTAAAGTHAFLDATDDLLRELNITYDVVRDENLDELKHYPVVLLAGYAETAAPAVVEALKAHVARGGKVMLFDHALGWDARTLTIVEDAPAFGFDKIAGVTYRYERWPRPAVREPVQVVGGSFLKKVKPGDVIAPSSYFPLEVKLVPHEGATVVAKMRDFNVGVISADESVLTLSIPHLRVDWHGTPPVDRVLRDLVGDALDHWKVKRQIALKGGPESEIEVRAMTGQGCWLAAVMNHGDAKRTAEVVLRFLPEGSYDVVDVTGERPIIEKDGRAVLQRMPDPEFRNARWVAKNVTAKSLASTGLSVEVDGVMARVLLIRPANERVWVNVPETTLRHLGERAGVVIVGDKASPVELAAAKKLIDAAALRKNTLVLRKASEIKVGSTHNEIWVDEFGSENPRSSTRQRYGQAGGYLVDVFENKPVETDTNLILVGSARTNELVRHFETPNTFTYDKMLMKATGEFPGAGRGFIGLVESVNRPAFDTSSFSRDAIVLAGSDDAGTSAAVDSFIEVLKKADASGGETAASKPPAAASVVLPHPVAAERQ